MTLEEAMAEVTRLTGEVQVYQAKEQGWQERETTLTSESNEWKSKYESQVQISSDLSKQVTSFVIPPKEEPKAEPPKPKLSFSDLKL